MTLIEMKTPPLHEHGDSLQASRDQFTLVPGDAGLRKTGNGRVGNVNGIGDLAGEKAEPRSEHDRHAGFELAKSLHHRGGGEATWQAQTPRSEEHTSELQSPCNLVCR